VQAQTGGGADTWGVECVPFEDPNVLRQGDQVLLAWNGIHMLENLDTAGLVGTKWRSSCSCSASRASGAR
jgi:hypothetical protein